MRLHPSHPKARPARGFTVIELLIAVVVLGIVSALAFPSFMSSIRKSRRSEAFSALSAVQLKQERWRANKPAYASSLTGNWPDAGLALPDVTPSGYYSLAIVSPTTVPGADDAVSYEITATAVADKSQARDGNCAVLGVKLDRGNLKYAASALNGNLSYAATNPCWSR